MGFEEIVHKILEHTKISHDDLMARIKQKQDELKGFVTPEGAAAILAREFGVELERKEPEVRALKIDDLTPGMSNVDIVGRVVRIYEPRSFQRMDGSEGRVASLLLQDQTGEIRIVLWDDKVSALSEIKKGIPAQIRGAYVKQGIDQKPEINVGPRASVIVDPDDPRVNELPPMPETKVKLADLKPDSEVDVLGRVAAVSEPRAFERPDGSKGKVATLMLLDATGLVRVSLWDEKADRARDLKRGDVVKLENAQVKRGLHEKPELQLGRRGRMIFDPPDPEVAELPQVTERLLKIEGIEADMPMLDFVARVRRKFPPQEFKRDDGTPGRVMAIILADETGTIRTSFWNGGVDLAQKLSVGDVVLLRNAYTRVGLAGKPEVHVGRSTEIEVNPAGITVGELKPSRIKLGELEPGMDALETVGRVTEVQEPREFTRVDGTKGKVATLVIGDQTGSSRVSLWQEHANKAQQIKVGDIIRLSNCYSTVGLLGQPEIHVGREGELEVNPAITEELPQADVLKMVVAAPERASIGSLQRERMQVQIRGTIIRVFHRRPLFDICPLCGRSLGSIDTSLMCEQCGKVVTPEHRVVISLVVDDGTGNIRAVLFGQVAEKLLGKSAQEVFELFKQIPNLEELYGKFNLVGREVLLAGSTRYDKYFDQLELRVRDVQVPDPRKEARRLLESIKAASV
jgi:replication factor A1